MRTLLIVTMVIFMKLKMPDPARKDENRLKSDEDKIKTPKDKHHAQQDAFQARALAENMVRCISVKCIYFTDSINVQAIAADSLLTITHSLKLMYLLSDEEEITTKKSRDLQIIREETRVAKEAVESEWTALFNSPVMNETTP